MERDMRDLDDLLDRLVVRQKRADQRLSDLERLETQGDASRAWAQAVGMLQLFPGVRGLWPMSAFDSNGDAQDISGHGLHLTMNSSGNYAVDGLAPFCALDGTADYFSRVDEANFDIIGTEGYVSGTIQGLTLGGWFWFDVSGNEEILLSKWNSVGGERSYLVQKFTDDSFRFAVSPDGSNAETVISGASTSINTWFFVACRFEPSTELKIWVNGNADIETSSIPASVFDSTAEFNIGARNNGGAALLGGRASLCFLCAAAVPDEIIETFYQYSKGLFS